MARKPDPAMKVSTLAMPYKALVVRADPDFEANKRKDPFYRFSNGRRFDENTGLKGAYSTVPNDHD